MPVSLRAFLFALVRGIGPPLLVLIGSGRFTFVSSMAP
jgi:hypothetical protein